MKLSHLSSHTEGRFCCLQVVARFSCGFGMPFHISHSSLQHLPDLLPFMHRPEEPKATALPMPYGAQAALMSHSPYLVRVDGVEISHCPVDVRQRRARAIAGDDSVLPFPHRQVHMAHADLREV